MTDNTTETIGCDLGDRISEICVLNADGRKHRASVQMTRKAMTLWFTRTPAHVVIEVGAHSRWVSAQGRGEEVEDLVHDVFLEAARSLERLPQRGQALPRALPRRQRVQGQACA